jgi:hypothetical protein
MLSPRSHTWLTCTLERGGRAPRLGVGEVPRKRRSLRAAVPLGFVLFV